MLQVKSSNPKTEDEDDDENDFILPGRKMA